MRKIVLIHPINDADYKTPFIRENKCPPTGLLILAKIIKDHFPEYQVQVLDSLEQETVSQKIQGAKIVGVTSIYANHQNCLSILERAKQNGSCTWIGGMNATVLARQILNKRPYVDYVFLGDAERAVISILEGKSANDINNLAFRKNGAIILNAIKPVKPDILFDLKHLSNPEKVNRQVAFNISSIRGCVKAAKGRCSFCSLQHKHLTIMEPEKVWGQIKILVQSGFNFFEESGDCFYVGDFPEKLLACRPRELADVQFKVYMRPEQITPYTLDVLKRLNIIEVFLGMESLDDEVLTQASRGCTEADILKAIELLAANDFGLHLPFIWGLPGTTKRTLEKNLKLAREVRDIFSKQKLEFLSSLAVPIIGSTLFANLAHNSKVKSLYPGNLEDDDIIDYATLIRLQTELFTHVTEAEIKNAMKEIYQLHPRTGGFGV
jgi:radical SAM superfamily enzyme YgiQ (UPF0313 family)